MNSDRKRLRHSRPARLRVFFCIVLALTVCAVVALSVLNRVSQNTTIRIKLHSSEELFLREAIQDIQLLPNKTDDDEVEEDWQSEKKPKCKDEKRKGGKAVVGDQWDDEDDEDENANLLFRIPEEELKDALKGRREKWSRQMSLKKIKQLGAESGDYFKHLDLTNVVFPKLLENYRNPCFYGRRRNISDCRKGPYRDLAQYAKEDNSTEMKSMENSLRCLPYFLVAGLPLSGVNDVMQRVVLHNDVTVPHNFSSEWLNRYRFVDKACSSVDTYLDFMLNATRMIDSKWREDGYHPLVTGEASTDILWDNQVWPALPGNEGQLQPRFTNADHLHHLNPNIKIIIVLTDPVARLYSDYWYQMRSYPFEPSSNEFNQIVIRSLDVLNKCLKREPIRTCVYDGVEETRESMLRIRTGIYYVMMEDWLKAFPRNQIHVINYETFKSQTAKELKKFFDFLDLRPPSEDEITEMLSVEEAVEDVIEDLTLDDPMDVETRRLLENFYAPWNKLLATVVEDETLLFY